VFLECPGPNTATGCSGHMLHTSPWADPEQGDAAVSGFDLQRLFYLEMAARLVVLRNLMARAVEGQGLSLTPLRWLLYQLSQDSFYQFTAVYQRMKTYNITSDVIVRMLHDVKIAQAALNGAADSSFGAVPVLVVDAVQRLSPARRNAVVYAASQLNCTAVWSGTRMDITAACAELKVAKHNTSALKQHVLGDFVYLTPERVQALFEQIVRHSARPATLSQLCHVLQGRARILASFISTLLVPAGSAMQAGCAELSDELLRSELGNYMDTMVVANFGCAIRFMLRESLMERSALGLVWCNVPLSNGNSDNSRGLAGTAPQASNSLVFTESAVKQEATYNLDELQVVKFNFVHNYGEPGLLEALLRVVRRDPSIADDGILQLVRSTHTAPALGSNLATAVALSILSRRATAMRALCQTHADLGKFGDYTLDIERIVEIRSAEQQLEWLGRVLADPDECAFSLLPGVPVKSMVLLPCNCPGADLVFVASRPAESSMAGTAAAGARTEPSRSYTIPRAVTRKRSAEAALLEEAETVAVGQAGQASSSRAPSLVLVHISCATYADSVTSANHEKNIALAGAQYRQLIASSRHLCEYVQINVEIPRDKEQTGHAPFIHVTQDNAVEIGLFGQEVVDYLASRSVLKA
jgi:hypothetical protein